MDDAKILCAWALRIDRGKINWNSGETLLKFRKELLPPSDIVKTLACFYDLQRWLFKGGGSQLPDHHPDWCAIRTLFLLAAKAEVPLGIRDREFWADWESKTRDEREAQIAIVARIHANTQYWMNFENFDADKDPSAQVALRMYDPEQYLIDDTGWHFRSLNRLNAFEFFSIMIWKANRAKSLIAKKLINSEASKGLPDLEAIVEKLTGQIASAKDGKERLRVLMTTWDLALPTSTAILTVLYPDEFTVYDVRACEVLNNPIFKKLGNWTWSEKLWAGYREYCNTVAQLHPEMSLRDNDRVLWSTSAIRQLQSHIKSGFSHYPHSQNGL